jgi:hypothetical protein
MPPLDQDHPWWCDFPEAPADATHTLGVAELGGEVSVDAVIVRVPGEAASLTLHVASCRASAASDNR